MFPFLPPCLGANKTMGLTKQPHCTAVIQNICWCFFVSPKPAQQKRTYDCVIWSVRFLEFCRTSFLFFLFFFFSIPFSFFLLLRSSPPLPPFFSFSLFLLFLFLIFSFYTNYALLAVLQSFWWFQDTVQRAVSGCGCFVSPYLLVGTEPAFFINTGIAPRPWPSIPSFAKQCPQGKETQAKREKTPTLDSLRRRI